MKIISYYTALYQFEAANLIKSLNKFPQVEYMVEERPQIGSWEANTQYKSVFILEKLRNEEAVVWTDADSAMVEYPKLFEELDCDAAFWFIEQKDTMGFKLPQHSILKQEIVDKQGLLQSGTMYFKNTPNTIKLLETWIEINSRDSTQWDQWTLQMALQEVDNINVGKLGPEFFWVDGVYNESFPGRNPIFKHYQASRKYKSRLNRV